MPSAVLFDLDGTFVDTAPDMTHALNRMRAQRDLSALSVEAVRPHVSRGVRGMLAVGFDLSLDSPTFESCKAEFFANYEARICVDSALFEGCAILIKTLGQRNIQWGIVTNKATRFAHPILDALGVASRTQCIVCGDTTAHTKPHPAPLLEAARQLGVAPSACWYIGDDERDMQAARAAGMAAIVAGYGYLGGTPPHTWRADATVSTPLDLLGLLASVAAPQ